MRVLVTGANGFVGRWMVEELARAGHDVTGTPPRNRLEIGDRAAVTSFVEAARPDAVVHLAGMAFGPDANRDPEGATRVNVDGTALVLDIVRTVSPEAAVVVAGSADIYGSPDPADLPLRESTPARPTSAYGRSKLAQEEVALAAARAGGLAIAVTRSFNHTGPGQRPGFVAPALARRILAAQRVGQDFVAVGNVNVRRDISDVRDVVLAYRLILEGLAASQIESGTVVNVASGRSIAIGEVLDTLAEIVGVRVRPQVDPALLRAEDPPEIVGDPSRLRSLTGWEPRIPLRQTLTDLIESLRSTAS